MKEIFANSQFWSMLTVLAAFVIVVASILSVYVSKYWSMLTVLAAFVVAGASLLSSHFSGKEESEKYQHLLGQIMGGDSFPIAIANSYKGDPPQKGRDFVYKLAIIGLKLNGKYPVRNLKIRAYDIGDHRETDSGIYYSNIVTSDLNIPGPYQSWIVSGAVPPEHSVNFNRSTVSRDIDVFKPEQKIILGEFNIEEVEAKGVDIYCDSDYQSWFINVRFLKNKNGKWTSAVRIRRIGTGKDSNSAWKTLKIDADGYAEKLDDIIWYKDGG